MTRGDDELNIWERPEPGERRARLTRGAIAQAALRLADREGFAAVSMRRLAAELGTGTMTLYRYVRTKDELLALMDDALMAESLAPPEELAADWRAALSAVARGTRAALLRHPWALSAMSATVPGPNAWRHFEQSLAALAGTGLDAAHKFELLSLVDDYVFGNALHAAEAAVRLAIAAKDPGFVQAQVTSGLERLRGGDFPHMAALLGVGGAAAPPPAETPGPVLDEQRLAEQFERGLGALLDGAARLMGLEAGGREGGTAE